MAVISESKWKAMGGEVAGRRGGGLARALRLSIAAAWTLDADRLRVCRTAVATPRTSIDAAEADPAAFLCCGIVMRAADGRHGFL